MTNEQQMKLEIWHELMRRQSNNNGMQLGYNNPAYIYTPEAAADTAKAVYDRLGKAAALSKRK